MHKYLTKTLIANIEPTSSKPDKYVASVYRTAKCLRLPRTYKKQLKKN